MFCQMKNVVDVYVLSFYGEGGAYHVTAAGHQGAVEMFRL